jgi:hypothetical protein
MKSAEGERETSFRVLTTDKTVMPTKLVMRRSRLAEPQTDQKKIRVFRAAVVGGIGTVRLTKKAGVGYCHAGYNLHRLDVRFFPEQLETCPP